MGFAFLGRLLFKFGYFWFCFFGMENRYSTRIIEKTLLFKITLNKYYLLMVATIFSGGIVYLDRFILYPMIGASAVTMYITASYFGKSISVLAQPASNVMLSYFSQGNFNFSMKKYYLINLLIIVSFSVFVLIALFFGKSITQLLFSETCGKCKSIYFYCKFICWSFGINTIN